MPEPPPGPTGPPPRPTGRTRETPRRPVEIEVAGGRWALDTVTDDAGELQVRAELTSRPANPATARSLWSTAKPTLAELEEELGWAIPHRAQNILTHHPPSRPAAAFAGPPSPPADVVRDPVYRPGRTSATRCAGYPPTTYGRLLHLEARTRRWQHGPVQVDIYRTDVDDDPGVVYRVSDTTSDPTPTVVFSGIMTDIPGAPPLTSDAVIRYVLLGCLARNLKPAGLTSSQRMFVLEQGDHITDAAPYRHQHPYPHGTRVAVHDVDPARTATGTVLALTTGNDGPAYLWRPDLADLPGHPWYHHPTWTARTPIHQVTHTLANPDTHTGPDAPPLLATGALVATVDDPRFAVGTVLRAFDDDEDLPSYEIQPHDGALPPLRLRLDDITPLRGSTWPSIDALLEARATAGLPPQPGEILTTPYETARVLDTPTGPAVTFPLPALRPPSLALDITNQTPTTVPEALTRPTSPHSRGPTAKLPTLRQGGDTIHIDDPIHGHLEVPTRAFQTAMRHPQHILTELLARRSWLPTTPDQPAFITAALTALHAPNDLAALAATATGPPTAHLPADPTDPNPAAQPPHVLPGTPPPPPDGSPTFDPGP
ncbi:hypothetical protein [Pseudofrankia sp. DC12]|uniref:hypothetical protein n=1 Tax=Pseudofrankia sp. DC12 TaxID=683315 RepID=UPI0005F873B5|nr:hypothetical protein [Pseudofrankia sp. DC12]